ncbi:glycosyltransferase family 4 protein [Amycolatopsis sp. PS_44_ISF1]|uniref:glycosyltransferase family 4 protein n=1 Tax=Amycolatopsis sp. PS_44_ISF1 TaxID=2974917 RepID=UPI0028DE0FE7|nr:glycosyltransferase family 4 protein [Amycolatopsis sp. PS_44_ISF1]MDT8911792.1 glycosyltransferase family 4 protein [Amycolatopsis sp. PS_44_ISF1]
MAEGTTPLRVLTGLDLPWGSAGGSVELVHDLYLGDGGPFETKVFMLKPDGQPAPSTGQARLHLLDGRGKCLSGLRFPRYVASLRAQLSSMFTVADFDVLHLQHLAFGATPALLTEWGDRPSLALVHGTDLIFATRVPAQRAVLQQALATVGAVVVPTMAMADRLRDLAGGRRHRIEHIPWGIPDRLVDTGSPRTGFRPDGILRVLYAGRLSAEKGFAHVRGAAAETPGTVLSVAAPRHEFDRLGAEPGLRYLGWLSRHELQAEFGNHDLLVVPSTDIEAFGLVAVEAQAAGLPVAYQPVPGLREVLGDTALPLDFIRDPQWLRRLLGELREDSSLLSRLSTTGRANAMRYRVSRASHALSALTADLLNNR